MYDVYNALTNYSSHNKRAIKIGKKNEEEYKIVDSKRDTIQSQEARDFEIRRHINSNHFIFYYHKALTNLGRSI